MSVDAKDILRHVNVSATQVGDSKNWQRESEIDIDMRGTVILSCA